MDKDRFYIEQPVQRSITPILAWTIIIDSALLNQRFHEDMKAAHNAAGCPCAPEGGLPLYLPHPPVEVCQAFNDYVRCRWPLHVFALDPATEDQNVGDAFSLRRELQLAMSLAFVGGKINANNFTRYVRRIEQDIQTISLNRTIVGFSHGDNVFGWRFYPRVQTPPIDSNFEAFFRDLLIGGYNQNYYLRRRRLEPGIRECVALVIMPSFVPYVDLEVTGNWFRLANPKCKALDLKDAMRLSRSVRTIQERVQLACDHDRYRAWDSSFLMTKLEQLSARLPLQRQLISVPYENTHGGFELLSTGVTNLAPELVGWYGAPGINPNGTTSLFLVGDNFSVHQTRVIVGGLMLDPSCPAQCTGDGAPVECKCATAPTVVAPPPAAAKSPAAGPADDASARTRQGEGVVQAQFLHRQPAPSTPPRPKVVTVVNNLQPIAATGVLKSVADDARKMADDARKMADDAKQLADSAKKDAKAGGDGTAAKKADDAKKTADDAKTTADQAQKKADDAVKATSACPQTCLYEIPHFQVELLSRQVMRVVIPKGVYSKDGKVDIHIATPYGVSPSLKVPILCSDPPPVAPAYGYAVDEKANSVKVRYTMERQANLYQPKFLATIPDDAKIKINWKAPTGSALKNVKVRFEFKWSGGTAYLPPKRDGDNKKKEKEGYVLTAANGSFVISNDVLKDMATDLVGALGNHPQIRAGNLLPPSIESSSIKLIPVSPPPGGAPQFAVQEVNVNQTVRFDFEYYLEPPAIRPMPPPKNGQP